jgi:hypothetical protein
MNKTTLALLIKLRSSPTAPQISERFVSLTVLEALLNLINKRPYAQYEFKKMDGYALLQRIYTSMEALNRYLLLKNMNAAFGVSARNSIECNSENSSAGVNEELNQSSTQQQQQQQNNATYYLSIQKRLLIVLLNGCFRKPVFCMNYYSNERIELCITLSSSTKSNRLAAAGKSELPINELSTTSNNKSIYLCNPDLLAQVVIEWTLWRPAPSLPISNSNISTTNNNLWRHIFLILHKLLESNHSSQVYHSNLFLRYNLLEKLMHFLLDANEENCIFDENSCLSLLLVFKHFNSIISSAIKTKQLFASFFDYLHILHPENRAYIEYSTKSFYYNLTLSN